MDLDLCPLMDSKRAHGRKVQRVLVQALRRLQLRFVPLSLPFHLHSCGSLAQAHRH